jgi:uncharacterized protein (DUF1697 family)
VTVRYVAFLRAINVAGHATVNMADLKRAFAAAGCDAVETCIQSGNVIFESSGTTKPALFAKIDRELRRLLGGEPVVIARTARELTQLEQRSPFTAATPDRDSKSYVVFLARKSADRPTFPVRLPKEGLEAIGMTDREVFVVSRRKKNGFYGFPNAFIEKELGVQATTRNWSTVARIVELLKR